MPGGGARRREPGQELGSREGLGDVVVGALVEGEHLTLVGPLGGDHDDRDVDQARNCRQTSTPSNREARGPAGSPAAGLLRRPGRPGRSGPR